MSFQSDEIDRVRPSFFQNGNRGLVVADHLGTRSQRASPHLFGNFVEISSSCSSQFFLQSLDLGHQGFAENMDWFGARIVGDERHRLDDPE